MASKSETGTGDIEEQIKVIRDDVSKLTKILMELGEDKVSEAMKTARGEAEDLFNRSRRMAGEASDRARQTAGTVEDYIAEKPFQSALIALLVGFLIGSTSRR